MSNLSLPKDKIRVVLFENIHDSAVEYFHSRGYHNIERLTGALDGEALKDKIRDAHMVGIRSRTRLTRDVLESAEKLMAVGCFCIGTNQVDLDAAELLGIPVFNAPYSNTRSVAELVVAEAVMMMRDIPRRNWDTHEGGWNKAATGCHEVRGKTLGIVGYGHIGTQVSVLAESMGMSVRYFDIVEKLAIGNAQPCATLNELMAVADVVTLHVPDTADTRDMIRAPQIAAMKDGAYLINASRGKVVDIDALAEALTAGKLRGAAVDVFPKEPASLGDPFESPLRGMRNVLLTPHIGGSTEEAQMGIGREVAEKLVKYSDDGSTLGAVNFPEVALPQQASVTRFLHIHRNVPGVMSALNEVFSSHHINIRGQYLMTNPRVGYVVVDVEKDLKAGEGFRQALAAINGTLRFRFLN
ncbi:D-3-phosphoglycerate dehydrogenase [Rhodospirillum rubrum ATCC 11170]|uniref:D-3-phosphoglycerate dehydrogenase n=1 Tax=Rhodospirillum rubrum (strain ATCC 11170 / ATH 1.1.1 / DSM 467 / LMG 4362 / NCIMB 8255 / S1) TaxID=269796 RepID=Q2RRI9_RHORT|nr:D-3-phosphoglycerate dehydrogenase [Rhodospirillum rubrum ATCC 11170]MBK5954896.1 D-3-phosphoglycerate dehydrogenase [Rhodospirillum rubrum]